MRTTTIELKPLQMDRGLVPLAQALAAGVASGLLPDPWSPSQRTETFPRERFRERNDNKPPR